MSILRFARPILAAALTNLAMGLLYCWTLFATPVATELNVSLTTISSVPSLSLVAFTIGVNVHSWLARQCGPRWLVAVVFALSIAGIALFAVMPSVWTILIGFGGLFGFASGVGYGLALLFVRNVSSAARGMALGICVTSFALTAIVLAYPVHSVIQSVGIRAGFGLMAICLAVLGGLVLSLCSETDAVFALATKPQSSVMPSARALAPVAFAFFACCFTGLAILSNSSVLLQDFGVAPAEALASAAVFNSGYVICSLFGAQVAESIGAKTTVLAILLIVVLVLLFAISSSQPIAGWLLIAAAACALGSTASVFQVYLGQNFGRSRVSLLFARMLVFYGLAGFVSPWIFAYAREYTGGVGVFLSVSAFLLCVGAIAIGSSRRPVQAEDADVKTA